ncbi:MAG: hypothetical protein KDJ87_12165 [Rhizobiaceae bacterium]|nr:hypothetical protein [Rhizobiaceae bacterium]
MTSNIGLVLVSALAACLFFYPRVLHSRPWRATVTPLASIIGSGFLVVAPILAGTFGNAAWMAMLALCAIGYLYGAVIRYNIRYVEPRLSGLPKAGALIERASDFMLSLAYFVSVAYYLNLFAAFGLRIFGVESRFAIQAVATAAIAGAGLLGLSGGLRALERFEVGAVGLKLSIISGLVVVLVFFAAGTPRAGPPPAVEQGFTSLQVLLGLVILVQGFETSRYLGNEYDSETRIRTMRHAQWISSAIYIIFVSLVTFLFQEDLPATGGETAIIDMLRPLGGAVAPLLIITALASQSSAAVADMNGAGGLLSETTKSRLSVNVGNLVTALMAIGITWSANIYEIIAYASKAFLGYYALQSVQAVRSSFERRQFGRALLFIAAALLAIAAIALGKPAAAQGENARQLRPGALVSAFGRTA